MSIHQVISRGCRILLTMAVVIAVSSTARQDVLAKCSPHKTLRIVTRTDDPQLPAEHFARQPKTLYRLGEKYGRMEEKPNPETGLHLLVVVNEPDLWMVNLADKTGQHVVDAGPTFVFHAPVLGDIKSEYWNNFEYGCEVPFMRAAKPVRRTVNEAGNTVYEHTAEGITASLTASPEDIPRRMTITTDEGSFSFVYDVFEQLDNADTTLFTRPPGIAWTERQQ